MTDAKSLTRILLAGTAAMALSALALVAHAADQAPAKQWKAPRTLDGQPDLQGVWTNATLTTLERPEKYGDRLVLNATEVKEIESAEASSIEESNKPTDPKLGIKDLPFNCGRGFSGTGCGYNGFWIDPGTHVMSVNGERRSSFIVDPANGKVPPLSAAAQAKMAARRGGGGGGGFQNFNNADGPEARPLGERCLMSFGSSAGPPMLPLLYNNNYQIVQNKDTVTILVEMVHDVRVVRLNSTHLPANIRLWMGDAIGHWEGDTLVVETTNFRKDQTYRNGSENMKVIERFTRISPQQILYKFTIDDPATFSKAWSGEVAMNASDGKIYEYACHEGNYALPGILAGAREAERVAAEKTGTK